MRRCQLKGQLGDALHAVLCASGYNIRWLLRWIAVLCAFVLARLRATIAVSPSRTQLETEIFRSD